MSAKSPRERISISTSNRKTETPSISLPPGKTCIPEARCYTPGGCYAWKMYFNTAGCYTNVGAAWDRNLRIYQASDLDYFGQIHNWLYQHRPAYFRWHVGGDFPDIDYLGWALHTATLSPDTQHTAYTKRYEWASQIIDDIPDNFTIMLSGWPGIPIPNIHLASAAFPIFWLRDPNQPDPRIPSVARECPGSCPSCRWCWDPKSVDITNHKH